MPDLPSPARTARDWLTTLARYREPSTRRSLWELAATLAPFLTLLLLWGSGYRPIVAWGSLWQWLVLTLSGGAFTPLCFWVFDRITALLAYSQPLETTFRPDREIKRGRR